MASSWCQPMEGPSELPLGMATMMTWTPTSSFQVMFQQLKTILNETEDFEISKI